jgi:type IV secretion system protein VirD4
LLICCLPSPMPRTSVTVWDFLLPKFLLRVLRHRAELHGSARWMTRRERKRLLGEKSHRGLVFGPGQRLSWEESFRNALVAAPTGSGKTTRIIIPNVLLAEGSVVVTDPSGEVYRATSGYMAERGFVVKVFKPEAPDESLAFDPVAYFARRGELGRLAEILALSGSSADEVFWVQRAAALLEILLQALVRTEDPRQAHLGNLWRLVNRFGTEGEGVSDFVCRYGDPDTLTAFASFVCQDGRTLANMVSSALAGTDLWKNPAVRAVTAADTLGIERLREEKTVLYLIVSEEKVRQYGLLLNLIYTACFEHCIRHGDAPLPVLFLLEEFAHIGRIDNFPALIATLRRRRCATAVILQDPAQLETLYGRSGARTIIAGGCANKVFFGGTDAEAARYVEESLGSETAWETFYGGADERARAVGKPLLRRDELRMLCKELAVVLIGEERPALLKLPGYFKVPEWRAAAGRPPLLLPGNSGAAPCGQEPECCLDFGTGAGTGGGRRGRQP